MTDSSVALIVALAIFGMFLAFLVFCLIGGIGFYFYCKSSEYVVSDECNCSNTPENNSGIPFYPVRFFWWWNNTNTSLLNNSSLNPENIPNLNGENIPNLNKDSTPNLNPKSTHLNQENSLPSNNDLINMENVFRTYNYSPKHELFEKLSVNEKKCFLKLLCTILCNEGFLPLKYIDCIKNTIPVLEKFIGALNENHETVNENDNIFSIVYELDKNNDNNLSENYLKLSADDISLINYILSNYYELNETNYKIIDLRNYQYSDLIKVEQFIKEFNIFIKVKGYSNLKTICFCREKCKCKINHGV